MADPKRIIHVSDAGTRHVRPLCRMAAPGDPVWSLARTRPSRVYVENTRYTILVEAVESLAQGGVELHLDQLVAALVDPREGQKKEQ